MGYATSGPNSCQGHVNGAGGDGGPGVVQIHTPRGRVGTDPATSDILVSPGVALQQSVAYGVFQLLELHADPGGGDVDVTGEGIEEEHHQGHIAKELEQLLVGHHAQATQAGAGEEGVHDAGLLLNSR